jgi:hypothetical protein
MPDTVIEAGFLGFGATAALLFGVSVDATLTVMSATNSSPQTSHLFAKDRASTLMWYVYAGLVLAVVVVGVMAMGAFREGGARLAIWPVLGGVLSGGGMLWLYRHAIKAGGGQAQPQGKQGSETFAYGYY